MGAAGNKKPKKAKTSKHGPSYEMEETKESTAASNKKKK